MTRWKPLWDKYRQPVLFCIVGGVNTVVDYAVYSLVLFFSGARESASDLLLLAAQIAGVSCGVANSYLMNRFFTFRRESRQTSTALQLGRFLLVNALTLTLSYGALWLLARWGVNPYLAKVPVVPITMGINYVGYKLFVFGGKTRDRQRTD